MFALNVLNKSLLEHDLELTHRVHRLEGPGTPWHLALPCERINKSKHIVFMVIKEEIRCIWYNYVSAVHIAEVQLNSTIGHNADPYPI